jgi:metallo-beta-lactamase class B
MRRTLVLGAVIALGGLSMAVLAQGPQGPSAAAIASMTIEKVKDDLYVVAGSAPGEAFAGGNTAVFITADGVTLVDTKLPGFGQALLDRVRTVTDKPVTRIINTHAHADHSGGNSFFPSVRAVVHENAHAAMERAKNLQPRTTYSDRTTIGSGRDRIDVYYFGRGHTDGDSFVVFTALRTMHVGDMFAWKALPFIDPAAGGRILESPETLAKAVAGVKNVDTIVNGHILVSGWSDLVDYAAFTKDFVEFAERSLKAGKTAEQAAAEYTVPARFTGYVPSLIPQQLSVRSSVQQVYDELIEKQSPAAWSQKQEPVRIFANVHYVGTRALSAILVASDDGHVLIDGTLGSTAPAVMANIRDAGFRPEDIKLIVNSHAHFDHAAGIGPIQRASGARVAATAASARVFERGSSGSDDPQYGVLPPMEAVRNVQIVKDGETLRVGPIAVTAHATPGHTPGGTSWSWRSCEGGRCVNFVYADSLTAVAADGFSFTRSKEYPAAVADFEKSFATLSSVPCDVLLTPHPEASDLWGRLAKRTPGSSIDTLVDPTGCRRYADGARKGLAARVARENAAP